MMKSIPTISEWQFRVGCNSFWRDDRSIPRYSLFFIFIIIMLRGELADKVHRANARKYPYFWSLQI